MAVKHKIKLERGGDLVEVTLTPMKAIRKNCLECSNFSAYEVAKCPITACPLFPFRFGKRPWDVSDVDLEPEEVEE